MARTGRPPVMTEEKLRQFKEICRFYPTLRDSASFLQISEDTIERYCKSLNLSFAEFRDQNMVHTRFNLVRKALQMAEGGNPAMMIFCLKNLCGWKDKIESIETADNTITINYKTDAKIKSVN